MMNDTMTFDVFQSYCPPTTKHFKPLHMLHYDNLHSSDIRWNFEKFLIDRNGIPVMRYSHRYNPYNLDDDIQQLLMESDPDV